MIEPDAFDELEREIARLNGLDAKTASEVVVAVGDVMAMDQKTGKVIADLEDGRRLLVKWPEDRA